MSILESRQPEEFVDIIMDAHHFLKYIGLLLSPQASNVPSLVKRIGFWKTSNVNSDTCLG